MSGESDDEVWRRDEVQSPCVRICLIDPSSQICVGCGRTGDEIARWSAISDRERAQILEELPARLAKAAPKRGAARRRRRDPRA